MHRLRPNVACVTRLWRRTAVARGVPRAAMGRTLTAWSMQGSICLPSEGGAGTVPLQVDLKSRVPDVRKVVWIPQWQH